MPAVVDDLAECRAAFFDALVARDGTRARAVVEEAVDGGVPVAAAYLEVLQPALYDIGHEWAMERLTVAEEHFATALVEQLLGQLSARMRVAPHGGRLAIVAGTPGELHAIGPRMVADFLEADGWEVLHLGAATPTDALVDLTDAEAPDLVALSTSTAGRVPGIAEVLSALTALQPRPVVAVGGQFWTEETSRLALELGADLVLRDVTALVARLRELVPPREL